MKHLLLFTSLFTAASAFSGEIKIRSYTENQMEGTNYSTQYFEYNEALGRAWVRINVASYEGDVSLGIEDRVLVPGLKYETVTQSVILEHEGKITTCAEYKTVGKGLFRNNLLEMKEGCKFEARWRSVKVDTGFEIKKTRQFEIFLIVE